jgi:hypothetical protein
LATKADVVAVKTTVADIRAESSASVGLAKADLAAAVGPMRADLATAVGNLRADIAASYTAITRWSVAGVLASSALAFTIAKFVH